MLHEHGRFCQTPVPSPDFSLGLGVDFVLPLSQEQEQQEEQEEQEPHQNIPEGKILEFLNLAESLKFRPPLIDFGGGSSSCDRGKTKSTPSLKT